MFYRALAFQMMTNTIGREDPITRIVLGRAVNVQCLPSTPFARTCRMQEIGKPAVGLKSRKSMAN